MKLNKKQKFYLGTYLLGYAIAVFESGVPSIIYLIPIKLFGILIAITLGRAFYLASERKPLSSAVLVGVKSVLVATLLIIVSDILKDALLLNGIDISFTTAPF
ncbi:hypothetical protein SH1V18_28190 [Vallitalea longa]|uniref:Uncharacterized protein n=1 Tax=Vallitalea longa TaxID=2936439 RepID=A0A9W5YE91_9FIRM|nr:hypothetical protein [Vallitalea longa]GKX30339.1 hypothetical protein SH1V18_28190 [Vallitalea longa]